MADNETQSSSSPPKRPSTALPDAKRSKTAGVNDSTASNELNEVKAEPEGVMDEWSPVHNVDTDTVNRRPLERSSDPWGKLVSLINAEHPDVVMYRCSLSVGHGLRCDLWVQDPTISKEVCVIKRIDDNTSGEMESVMVQVTGKNGRVIVNGSTCNKDFAARLDEGDHMLHLDFGSTDKRTYIFERILPPNVSAASTSEAHAAGSTNDQAPAPAPAPAPTYR